MRLRHYDPTGIDARPMPFADDADAKRCVCDDWDEDRFKECHDR